MKYIFFLILLILFCKDSDSKENKEKLILYSSWYKVQSDINYKNTSCNNNFIVPSDTPDCIKSRIQDSINRIVTKPPSKVTSYVYKKEKVFSVSGNACCDTGGGFLNIKCEVICARSGQTGMWVIGDCSDFDSVATNETLIWEDKRNESGGCK